MDPNRQGNYQPDQGQPAAPQPLQAPTAPLTPPLAVSAADVQAALNDTTSQPTPQAAPASAPVVAPAPDAIETSDETTMPISGVEEAPELDDDQSVDNEAPVSWVAHEYIHREKGAVWFILFAIIIAALVAVSIFTKAWSFTALIAVIAVVVIVYTRRPPRELAYSLTDEGLTVDGKLYQFSGFKSFGVIRDGQEFSVMLIPVQRFQPGVTVYFPEEAGEDIVDMLGSRLPMKDLRLDVVDRVVRLLRL